MTGAPNRLVLCAKSRWQSTPRREHLLAMEAASRGIEVTFIEQAEDIRVLRGGSRREFLRSVLVGSTASVAEAATGTIEVSPRGTIAPGHRGGISLATDTRLLLRDLEQYDSDDTVVVATTPWLWPAVSRLRRARRVVDLGDDWSTLIPRRSNLIDRLHQDIGRSADEVVVASESLAGAFGDRRAVVVRNATDRALLEMPTTPRPCVQRMIYVGTLSERFDASLLSAVLDRLPGWRVELYGPALYSGGEPDGELRELLGRPDGRATWHGSVERAALASTIDRGDVLLIPNRAAISRGQDSMKVYDYLARGRAVVASAAVGASDAPGVRIVSDAAGFAEAVAETVNVPDSVRIAQRQWAAQNTYTARWPSWWAAVSGAAAQGAVAA